MPVILEINMSEQNGVTIHLEQIQDYEFKVKFDLEGVPPLLLDEPEPLGHGNGPGASRLLAAAVANCLSASLIFCFQKFKQKPKGIITTAKCTYTRNARGRLRVSGLEIEIKLDQDTSDSTWLKKCLEQFEDFCVVTESVRQGIPVQVKVVDAAGQTIS